MDARCLKLADSSMDIVVDKGMLDSILCGRHAYINAAKMLKEIQRVLVTDGTYFALSF